MSVALRTGFSSSSRHACRSETPSRLCTNCGRSFEGNAPHSPSCGVGQGVPA